MLAGGDIAAGPTTTLSLTLVGCRWPEAKRFVGRNAARSGEILWLGAGSIGEAAIGCALANRGGRIRDRHVDLPAALPTDALAAARRALRRHFAPAAQLELGRWLASLRRGAATDISDGLARDLHHLCAASRVGAVVEEKRLPIPPSLRRLASALGLDPLERALGGGEDYMLLFTLPPGIEPDPTLRCRRIGHIDATEELRLKARDGTIRPLPNTGWDHLVVSV